MAGGWRRTQGSAALGLVAFLLAGAATAARGDWRPHLLHFTNAATRAAVELAILGAGRRVQIAECQKLLTDFIDLEGRPLADNLAARQLTALEYLGTLRFANADHSPQCGELNTRAFTRPGSAVVFICGTVFRNWSLSPQGAEAERVIIHEMLHTLGLGENGRHPTSAAISKQVRKRCN